MFKNRKEKVDWRKPNTDFPEGFYPKTELKKMGRWASRDELETFGREQQDQKDFKLTLSRLRIALTGFLVFFALAYLVLRLLHVNLY